jgi:Zn-dependent protease
MSDDHGHFRILDVPVRVRVSFFVVAALLGFVPGQMHLTLLWIACIFVCILVHEAGHAFVARAFGHSARIEIHALGGTTFHKGAKLTKLREILVLLAGPFAGFALGGVVWLLRPVLPANDIVDVIVRYVLWATLGYGVLNLVPIMPLDGGQAVRILVGERRMFAVEIVVGVALIVGTVMFEVHRFAFLIAWLLIMRARELKDFMNKRADTKHGDALAQFDEAMKRNDTNGIVTIGEPLLGQMKSAAHRARIAHAVAHAHAHEGRFQDADNALAKMPSGWTTDADLQGTIFVELGKYDEAIAVLRQPVAAAPTWHTTWLLVESLRKKGEHEEAVRVATKAATTHGTRHILEEALYYAGRFDDALKISSQLFAEKQCPVSAYNAACSCMRLNKPDDAMQWFTKAVDAGFADVDTISRDTDIDLLRARAELPSLVERVKQNPKRQVHPHEH